MLKATYTRQQWRGFVLKIMWPDLQALDETVDRAIEDLQWMESWILSLPITAGLWRVHRPQPFMAKPPAGSSLLFGALADSGQIKQRKNGSYRIVLDDVTEIDWFTDRKEVCNGEGIGKE